jgi:hypothetical protein
MKKAALTSLKLKKLQRRLKLPLWQAIGLLETLWKVTESDAPAGDIGKHSNADLALAIEWEGDADELISALLECGWLDASDKYRLAVHNWPVHAPNYLKGGFAKNGKTFIRASEPKVAAISNNGVDNSLAPAKHLLSTCHADAKVTPTSPNLSYPSNKNGRQADRFNDFWRIYPKKVKKRPACEKWKAKHLDAKADELIADVANRLKSDYRWKAGYIPDPPTYLTQERWEDEITTAAKPADNVHRLTGDF